MDQSDQLIGFQDYITAIAWLVVLGVASYFIATVAAISEPVVLLAGSAVLLVTNVVPPRTRTAIVAVYRFSAKVLVFPVLVIVGLLYSPWPVLVAGFSINTLLIACSTVLTLAVSGYLISLWVGLEPFEGALIAVSRAAMGGTGDIAILSAARRLDLMPFAQITTRLGGAVTVFIALLSL